jgi:hypothetical protein
MTASYYIHRNGRTIGPFSGATVVDLLRAQQVGIEDLAVEEGCDDWQPLAQIVALSLLSPQAPLTSAAPAPAEVRSKVQGRIIEKQEFVGVGALVQLVGLTCIPAIVIAPELTALWIILFLILMIIGHAMSVRPRCSACGTKLSDRHVKICPGCKCTFEQPAFECACGTTTNDRSVHVCAGCGGQILWR